MTTLICDFQDIVGERINGYATLSAGEIRIGHDAPTVVLNTASPPEQVVEGEATFENVEPGTAILQLHWDRQTATLRFTIPNTPETVTLSECVEQTLEYTPPVISHSMGLIQGARDDALEQVTGAVDSAIAPYVIQVDHDKELAQDAAATSIAHAVLAGDASQGAYESKDLSQDAAVVSVTHAVLAETVIADALDSAQDDVVRIAVEGAGDMVDAIMSPYVDAVRHEKELAQDAGAVVATGLELMQDLVKQMNTP